MELDQPVMAVHLFGPLRVEVAGCTFGSRDFGGVKAKQLPEVLLLEPGRTVPKDRIADRIWGERLPQRVGATIESCVSLLRRPDAATDERAREQRTTTTHAEQHAAPGDDTIHAVINPRWHFTGAIHVYSGGITQRPGRSEWDEDTLDEIDYDFERVRRYFEAENAKASSGQ